VKLVEEVLRQVVHPSLAGTSGGSESRETRRLALGVYSSALEPRGQLHRPKLQRAGVSQSSKVDSHIFALYISTALQRSTLYILYTLPQVFNQTAPLLIERGFSARARVLTFSHTSVLVFCETPFNVQPNPALLETGVSFLFFNRPLREILTSVHVIAVAPHITSADRPRLHKCRAPLSRLWLCGVWRYSKALPEAIWAS